MAICVPPASPAVAITVRRFGKRAYSAAQLVAQGALPEHVRQEAERVLHTRRNILVSGGTGSGKTTPLNALIELLPDDERIVAIEDTLELRIDSPNCVGSGHDARYGVARPHRPTDGSSGLMADARLRRSRGPRCGGAPGGHPCSRRLPLIDDGGPNVRARGAVARGVPGVAVEPVSCGVMGWVLEGEAVSAWGGGGGGDMTRCRIHERCRLPNPRFLFVALAMYGRFVLTPQGPNFMRWTEPQIAAVLWSWNHGLFSWTPALLLAAVGLYWLHRHDRLLGWGSAVVVLTAVYINASVVDWWGGEAFGARRFIGYTVFFALGLTALVSSELWHRHARAVRLVATCLIASNVLFLAQYQVAMRSGGDIVEYPVTAAQVLLERLRRRGAFSVAWHETKRLSGASSGPEPTGQPGRVVERIGAPGL